MVYIRFPLELYHRLGNIGRFKKFIQTKTNNKNYNISYLLSFLKTLNSKQFPKII